MTIAIGEIMESCWRRESANRPSAQDVKIGLCSLGTIDAVITVRRMIRIVDNSKANRLFRIGFSVNRES